MVKAGEIVRVLRGRYGPLRPRSRVVPHDVAPTPEPKPVAPIPPAANGVPHANGAHQHQAPKPGIPADPGVSLRDELARELIERRLGIKEDQPVDSVEAPRPSMDFETFLATIGGKYVRAGLCPPFRLRSFASGWIASGIAPEHCLAVVDRHLREHAASRPSGSLDGLLPHLNDVVRHEWANRHTAARAQRQVLKRPSPGNALDDWASYTARAPRLTGDEDWEGNY
jgi:hypothetical protein